MGIESSHNKEPTHQYPIVAVKLSLRLSHCTDRRTAMPTGSLAKQTWFPASSSNAG